MFEYCDLCGDNTICTANDDRSNVTCLCKEGYFGIPEIGCENTNECFALIDPCGNDQRPPTFPEKDCNDVIGSYICKCPAGFEENNNGFCEDVDECLDKSLYNCDETISFCVNTVGSYTCSYNETICEECPTCGKNAFCAIDGPELNSVCICESGYEGQVIFAHELIYNIETYIILKQKKYHFSKNY